MYHTVAATAVVHGIFIHQSGLFHTLVISSGLIIIVEFRDNALIINVYSLKTYCTSRNTIAAPPLYMNTASSLTAK